jgi:hypothetical protein
LALSWDACLTKGRGRPFISPQQAAAAVRNEKTQLEVAVIEQQLAIISAFRAYESSNPEARLLMEKDSAESLVTRKDNAKPADLYRYQGQSMANMDFLETSGEQFYSSVCKISDAYREDLLDRWTRLRQVEESMGYEQKQKRDTQQPTVETDSEEDADRAPAVKAHTGGAFNPAPLDTMYDYTAPLSPTSSYGASPRSSLNSFASQAPWPPMSPAPNPPSTPIKAAAAVEARDTDDEGNLEIPWTLCTRKYHWRYIDDKLKDSNTDMLSSEAYKDRNSWTEILATWVCKEAIKEQGYDYTQVQKERRVGRQTKFETCFCIQQALTFEQVRSLVERTVEIYRASQTETPPLSRRRSSSYAQSQLPTPPRPMPVARNTLDRTASLPAKTPPNLSIPNWNRHPSTPPNSYPPHPSTSFPPQYNQHPPWAPYPSPSSIPYYPPNTGPVRLPPNNPAPLHPKRRHNSVSKMDYLDVSSTSDSDDTAYQKRRSRSRRSSASSQKKKKKHSTVGTLAKVGGLVTLLDGIADLGVL